MTRFLHLHEAAVGECADEFFRLFIGDDVAQRAPHDQGRALDFWHRLPQFFGAVRCGRGHIAGLGLGCPAGVVLPGPFAVGKLAQVVIEAAAQDTRIAQGIELHRPFKEFVGRVQLRRGDKVADARPAGGYYLRTDVDYDQPGHVRAMPPGIIDCVDPAHRLPHQHRAAQLHLAGKALDVTQVAVHAIVRTGRPFAVAVPALIEGDTAIAAPQHQADHVPGMGVEPAPVQKQYGSRGVPGIAQSR